MIKQHRTSRRHRSLRNCHGATLAEAAASFSFMFPVCLFSLFGIVAVILAFVFREGLTQSAYAAARDMTIQYGISPAIANDRSAQDAYVYNYIRHSIVTDSSQFDDAVFTTETINGQPKTAVTVTARYTMAPNAFTNMLTGWGLSTPTLSATSTLRAE